MKDGPLIKRIGELGLGLAIIVTIFVLIALFVHGMVWASEKALPWVIDAGQISFAVCGFVFLPLCIFRHTRLWAGLGFFLASYVFGTELFAYSCIVAFQIWGYAGLIWGLLLGGIGVVPVALFASLFAAVRHQTQWGLFWDILFMVFLTFGTRFLGIYLSTPRRRRELESEAGT